MENNNEKKNNILMYLLGVVLLVVAFLGGFFLNRAMNSSSEDKNDKNNNENTNVEKVEPKEEKTVIGVMDSFIFEHGHLYIINNGDVYKYETIDKELTQKYGENIFSLTHSKCMIDNSDPYCMGNPPYDNKAIKVEGLSNVKRLKLFNKPLASDESFAIYAITEEGNVYSINIYPEVPTVSEFLSNNDVEDMLGTDQSAFEIILKNGKHMIYKWECTEADGNCTLDNSVIYEEKK